MLNNYLKKIFSISIIFIFIFSIFIPNIFGDINTIMGCYPSSNNVSIGSTFNVTVWLDANVTVDSWLVDLSYNTAVLGIVNATQVTIGNFWRSSGFYDNGTIDNNVGRITGIQAFVTGGSTSNTTLFTVDFIALQPGICNIILEVAEAYSGGPNVLGPWYNTSLLISLNNAPYQPSNPIPSHNSINVSINTDLSWTGGDPDIGDTVTYNVSFGTSSNPPIVANIISSTTYDPGVLNYDTQYYWRIESTDNNGASTISPIWTFRTGITPNDPPLKPRSPDGPPYGRYLKSYTFTTSTTDPDGDSIYYRFDWDDGTISKWIGPYESGQTAAASHAWTLQGTYAIKVQAKDENGEESVWSDPSSVTMPKNKFLSYYLPIFYDFLENHPRIFPILRKLIGL